MLVGSAKVLSANRKAEGVYVTIGGEQFYEIRHADAMQPFFISLASDTDLWMYIASTGGLSCGRQSPDKALFPYYTDDKITKGAEETGAKTILHVTKGEDVYLWEPFSDRYMGVYDMERRIAKSVTGNKLLFTEINHDLGLQFSYLWTSADAYGWVRKAMLHNLTDTPVQVELLDGLQNVLPSGTNRVTQNTYSTLVDGYKKTELVEGTSLMLFRMEAIMVDRAEPSESLRCNTIYTLGLPGAEYLCSSRQLDAFRRGEAVVAETESKGVCGAIIAHTCMQVPAKGEKAWYFVADVDKDAVQVRDMIAATAAPDAIASLDAAIAHSTDTLRSIVAQNDGIQRTGDSYNDARHFANVLFNTMRGGFYCDDYMINSKAFAKHVYLFNHTLAAKQQNFLEGLPETISRDALERLVQATNDKQLYRLYMEYLPLTFSRRHGDPSRPWNLFNIRVNDSDGNRLISYQGNWRDIFQNWEALSLSYPGYINGIIAKFLNATTADGYNPYKVTSEGIDWEVINPDDPWSNIGYWGDHQIIYLCKLLELSCKHNPQALYALLSQPVFAYANVPYRFKAYADIVADPKNTLTFDDGLHNRILSLVPQYGQDARLLLNADGEVHLATFTEKVLVTLLAKLTNFIPEAGIWMNTLRPEWNDANNALVGNGASMVTLYYMRRYVNFLLHLFTEQTEDTFEVSTELRTLLAEVLALLKSAEHCLESGFTDEQRKNVADSLGKAGDAYRTKVYAGFAADKGQVEKASLVEFFELVLRYIDQSIRVNKREDGLYNAYNIVTFSSEGVHVEYLYPMLEGQVAALSAEVLTPAEAADLLDAMRHSDLYREDQRSYMLYPARRRASFLEKNNLPKDAAEMPEVQYLLKNYPNKIILADADGGLHFNGGFNNAEFLKKALAELPGCSLDEAQVARLLALYEQVFCHKAFTGRSGTFYKYEGLGCIYWHMVSKLLLAVGENIAHAAEEQRPRLIAAYEAIREGIGAHKQPAEYGSFPFDPYSHTPSMAGVQQPGMTGQVKEDILSRYFELGIQVVDGEIHIDPFMLHEEDFEDGRLRFTYCGAEFEYRLGGTPSPRVLDKETAYHIFARDHQIKKIIINL